MPEYIDRFNSVEEIEKCAEYYVELLGLQDWRIIYKLTDDIDENLAGLCESERVSKIACISIRKDLDRCGLWFKQPHEEILIHELLHCVIPLLEKDTVEGALFYDTYHQILDSMARAIFKTRYNLTNKDFYFKREE